MPPATLCAMLRAMLCFAFQLPDVASPLCQVSSVSGKANNQQGEILMALGYLASYQHMGSFSVECIAGCACEGVQNHTASHGWPSSYYKMVTDHITLIAFVAQLLATCESIAAETDRIM